MRDLRRLFDRGSGHKKGEERIKCVCVSVLGENSSKMDFRKSMKREKGPEKRFEVSEFLVSIPTEGGSVSAQGLQKPRKKKIYKSFPTTFGQRTDEMEPSIEKPNMIIMQVATIWLEACIAAVLLLCRKKKTNLRIWWHCRRSINTTSGHWPLASASVVGSESNGNAVWGTAAPLTWLASCSRDIRKLTRQLHLYIIMASLLMLQGVMD